MAVSISCAGPGFGFVIYPIIFDYCRQEYGYRGGMLIISGISLNSLPLAILMTSHPDMPIPSKETLKKHKDASVNDKQCVEAGQKGDGKDHEEEGTGKSLTMKKKKVICGFCLREIG